jgi:hypothetical protein
MQYKTFNNTVIYDIKYLVVVINYDAFYTISTLNLYKDYYSMGNNMFTPLNFGVDPSIYGTDLNGYCISGSFDLWGLAPVDAYLKYDMGPTGLSSFSENSNINSMARQTLCFRQMGCPIDHPFRLLSDRTNCYTCDNYNLLIPTCTCVFI